VADRQTDRQTHDDGIAYTVLLISIASHSQNMNCELTKSRFSRDFHKNIKIEQFDRRTCRLMIAALKLA